MSISLLETTYGLIFVMAAASTIQWIATRLDERWVGKVGPTTILLIEAIVSLIVVAGVIYAKGPKNLVQDVRRINRQDLGLMALFSIAGLITSYIVITLLKHHPTHKVRLTEFIADIVVSGIAVYILKKGKISAKEILALILIMIGGWLIVSSK